MSASVVHWPDACVQRGEKGQPCGNDNREGVLPAIWFSGAPGFAMAGSEAINPAV